MLFLLLISLFPPPVLPLPVVWQLFLPLTSKLQHAACLYTLHSTLYTKKSPPNAIFLAHLKKKHYLCSAKVEMTKQDMLQPQAKQQLIGLLKEEQCFWSYSPDSIDNISDDILIEKVLLYLDMPQIDTLFQLYPYKKIKQVWLDRLIPQLDYYYSLNRFFAWYYFKSKRPDQYVKSMATRHFNSRFK